MIFHRVSVYLIVLVLSLRVNGAEDPVTRAAAAPATAATPPIPTVIESGTAEMVSTEKESTFTFRQGVTVTATNMKITCDNLVVIARRAGDPAATIGKQENFKSMIATGNVRILQNDREATCDRAEVFPGDDKVILSGNPKVRSSDGQLQATGGGMELFRGERRARILGEGNERPRITLPPLKDLGYEKEKEKKKAPGKGEPAKPPSEATPPSTRQPIPVSPK